MKRVLGVGIAITLAAACALGAEQTEVLVEGKHLRFEPPSFDYAPYSRIHVWAGGDLELIGRDILRATELVIGSNSRIRPALGLGPLPPNTHPIHGSGSGGSFAGRGGGPQARPAFNNLNGLRRIDDRYSGGAGSGGASVTRTCPQWPFHDYYLPSGPNGIGGGSIRIEVERLTLEGAITANGSAGMGPVPGSPYYCVDCVQPFCDANAGGGGSGGSIIILARELIVGASAVIQANGGAGGVAPSIVFKFDDGYAGGGGRVKIYYETGSIDPGATIEAKAGWDPHTPEELWGMWAEDGTVYIRQVNNIDHLFKPSGDANNDGKVDKEDLMVLMSQWGEVEPTHTPTVTPTQVPTEVPTPTRTARPTWTPIPTSTPTATPTATQTPTPAPTTIPAPTAEPTPETEP